MNKVRARHIKSFLEGELFDESSLAMIRAKEIWKFLNQTKEKWHPKNSVENHIKSIGKEYWQKGYSDLLNAMSDVGLVKKKKEGSKIFFMVKYYGNPVSVKAFKHMKNSLKEENLFNELAKTGVDVDSITPNLPEKSEGYEEEKKQQMSIKINDEVLKAIRRVTGRYKKIRFSLEVLIHDELMQLKKNAKKYAVDWDESFNRVLQDLRDEGCIYHTGGDIYLYLEKGVDIELEELSDSAIDYAIEHNKLKLGKVEVSDERLVTRRRKGQARLREFTLKNYDYKCALCDVADTRLLVASHISRWADDPDARGDLSNIICLCKFHDTLFEVGYFSFTDELKLLVKDEHYSKTVKLNIDAIQDFRLPQHNSPNPVFLKKHRCRTQNDK